jgi:hypothetical protein
MIDLLFRGRTQLFERPLGSGAERPPRGVAPHGATGPSRPTARKRPAGGQPECSRAAHSAPSQDTSGFQSANVPFGFSRHAHTCSS